MSHTILGIGAPIVDHIVEVSEAFVQSIKGAKGGMEFVSHSAFKQLLNETHAEPLIIAGGSSTNTIKGLANFGHSCAITGMLSDDEAGNLVCRAVQRLGIKPFYLYSTTPTGLSLCLVTPDNERTLRTYSGAVLEMKGSDLDPKWFEGVKLVHIEGYSLANEGLTERAMELAKQAGALVSFDLSSFEITNLYKERIVRLIVRYVDYLFANQLEAETFTKLKDPEKAIDVLNDMCGTVVVYMGDKGGWAANQKEKLHYAPFKTNPLDSTGAGDLFASGFLHGALTNQPLLKCAQLGAITASTVVGVYGAEIPADKWSLVKELVRTQTSNEI